MLQLAFELTLLSDYHVSAGRRAGPTVDSALLRDHDQAPILRGTAVAGLLRDGLRDLLELPPAQKIVKWVNEENGAMTRLFGSPAQRKRWAFSSARPRPDNALIEAGASRWGSQDVMRVRINPRTRRADPQKLFNQEEGDARLNFYFTVTCDNNSDADVADASLLVAASRLVRHLGSARRRGRGECRLELVEATGFPPPVEGQSWTDKALAEFQERWLRADEPPKLATNNNNQTATLTLSGPRQRFRLAARALEPVLIARRAEAGNAYETLPMILGTAILGALANRAAHRLSLGPDEDAPPDFVTLFLRGGVRASGLLPAVQGEGLESGYLYPTAPAPQALFTCENYPAYNDDISEPHPVHDALSQGMPEKCAGADCEAKLDAIPDFLTLTAVPRQFEPERCEEIHIQMNRNGRVRTGDLYEYIALQAGQWFIGELDCANEACWQMLRKLTRLETDEVCRLRVGKASQRGYGLLEFVLQPLAETTSSPLTLSSVTERIQQAEATLRLLILTDTIIADPWGRFYLGFDRCWLAELFDLAPEDVKIIGEIASNRSVDTFHTHRRMPRWRDEAITPGSTADVQITPAGLDKLVVAWRDAGGQSDNTEQARLAALQWKIEQIEAEGIGLRRHEGFGRVAFNHLLFGDEIDEWQTQIDLDDLPAGFKPQTADHFLQAEEGFRRTWMNMLDTSQKDNSRLWRKIDAGFEPVGRLLFLSRYQELARLEERLKELGRPDYLWGKEVAHREKDPKLDQKVIGMIRKLVNQLADKSMAQQAVGLELLGERIVIAARKKGGQA